MALRLYNTLTNQKEDFKPVEPGKIGIYVCGPTVYKDSHIGHAVGPVIFDAFKKFLVHQGYEVKLIINITDVDDKIIIESQKQGVSMEELAKKVTASYFECLKQLGVNSVDEFPRATDHIQQILDIIQKLMKKDAAYPVDGDVYFDVTKDDDYGKLSNRRLDEQTEGSRDLASKEKRNAADFALWKAAGDDEIGWDSPWGRGRPGWHIECSAMSMEYLGETFDIHGGGIDLVFPHHENEIAQSETATGKPFANYWLHNGLTRMRTKAASGEWKNEKMSKSLGNIKPIKDLLEQHSPQLLRYFLLSTQYRSPIDFSDEAIEASEKGMMNIYRLLDRVNRITTEDVFGVCSGLENLSASDETDQSLVDSAKQAKDKFIEALEDDFNTAGALAEIFDLCNAINRYVETKKLETVNDTAGKILALETARQVTDLGQILGLFQGPIEDSSSDGLADDLMQLIIELRAQARQDKNYALSDAIRDGLGKLQITLEDRPDGTTGWSRS